MPDLSPQVLNELLQKLDDVCRQAQELQHQIREAMAARATDGRDGVASSDARRPASRRRTSKP